MQRFNFYLSEVQVARLREKSGLTGLSTSELVRRAIDAYLDGPPVPAFSAVAATGPGRPAARSQRRRPDLATQAHRIAALAVDEEGPRDFDPEPVSPGGVAAGSGADAGHETPVGSNRPPLPDDPGHPGGDATSDDEEGVDEDHDGEDGGGDGAEAEKALPIASVASSGPACPVTQQEAATRLTFAEQTYELNVFFRAEDYGCGEDEAALRVLRNLTLSLPPLFRYCVALGMAAQLDGDLPARFEELATRFEAEAVAQYSASPAAYDREWGGLIPDRIREKTGLTSRA